MNADVAKARATEMVSGLGRGATSPDDLMPLVYDELRKLARAYLARERAGHTLEPTALVHEAYLQLVDESSVDWQGRTHFLAVGAWAMRRLLVDHARRRGRAKRGGDWRRVTMAEAIPVTGRMLDPEDVLALDEALEELARHGPRPARVVELRFFGGLSVTEVAQVLDVSQRTVDGDWAYARAWLRRRFECQGPRIGIG